MSVGTVSSPTPHPLRALLVAFFLLLMVACAQPPAPEPDTAAPAVASDPVVDDAAHHGDEAHHEGEALPLPKRLAFMAGHVEAGLALYRAGEPEMAAPHLLHPVSETHAAEREGLDALGFDGSLFEVVSHALEAGLPASEVEPQLVAAEANLASITQQACGAPKEIILYLMDTVVEEYQIGVPQTTVTDAGEYQDAFGFTKVAIQRAGAFDGEAADRLRSELANLLALWPEAPIPPVDPTPFTDIAYQVEQVRDALSALDTPG